MAAIALTSGASEPRERGARVPARERAGSRRGEAPRVKHAYNVLDLISPGVSPNVCASTVELGD